MNAPLPLLPAAALDRPIIRRDGTPIHGDAFLRQAAQLAQQLPGDGALINLCEDRYHFLLLFAAGVLRNRCNLLPPSRAEQVVADLQRDYPGSESIDDAKAAALLASGTPPAEAPQPDIPAERVVALLFTSGSTGRPKAQAKRWGELALGARLTRQRLPFSGDDSYILATVPAQHMFGLETTVMLPLATGIAIDSGRPFFPADVHASLTRLPSKRALITTPLHLKHCLGADLVWPRVDFVLSATAPMPTELALRAEAAFDAPLLEIYGSTETGALATRRSAVTDRWQPLEGVGITPSDDGALAQAPHLPARVALGDRIEFDADGSFRLLGRSADLLKIAGKRASLAELNGKLAAIPGVVDGAFVMPADNARRLAALVVAPGVSKQTILEQLRRTVDPAFLPRPLLIVDQLPRNDTGKLPRQALLDLLRRLESR
jgi:acyl-coenzyme A synthetase/AMP-(fatty) acid ligase